MELKYMQNKLKVLSQLSQLIQENLWLFQVILIAPNFFTLLGHSYVILRQKKSDVNNTAI